MRKSLILGSVLVAGLVAIKAEARPIRIVGSSTVYPFTKAVSEQFIRKNPRFQPPIVESTGTGSGMKLFCAGIGAQHPDIEDASRRIKASEIASCRANGVTRIAEIQVGLDGLVFAESRRSPSFRLTQRDIYLAIAAEPFGRPNHARTWKDVNRALPAVPIRVYGPPPTSGTRDALAELILTPACKADKALAALEKSDANRFKNICTKLREDGAFVEAGENDNLIVQKLAVNPGTIGIFGFSYLEENSDKVTGIPINGVSPTYDNIANFKYPGSRPLYLYVKLQHVRAVPGIREFLAEYAREATWGRQGYLARAGMVSSPEGVRARAAKIATSFTPLDLASVK